MKLLSGKVHSFARLRRFFGIFALLAALETPSFAYSVLTHEAIIDTVWDDSLKPLIKSRFPNVTDPQLLEAHAYAYGGAIIQDMGYYPFSSKLFSDLVHYVRSGDFVVALLHEARDPNELAFALGALAHYAADNSGHPIATNHAVPMLYPKLRAKYGDPVTYEDDPGAHLKTEFGFDVLEVAHGNYAPKAYHDFIGFQVSKPVLERAFLDTYSIPLDSVFANLDLALGSYRRAVSGMIPEMTRAAWDARKNDIEKTLPGVTRRKFIYNLQRSSYEKEWGKQYERPGPGAKLLAFLFRMLPKVGPLKALGFRVPTAAAEKLFMDSFNQTLTSYRAYIGQVRTDKLQLADSNLDTGKAMEEGTYLFADKTYSKLLEKLGDQKTAVAPELRTAILSFFAKPDASLSEKALIELNSLRRD